MISETAEHKLIFKLANAQVYGVYADAEVAPLDPNYNDYEIAAHWDDAVTRDPDEAFSWIVEYLENNAEDDEDVMEYLIEFKEEYEGLRRTNSNQWSCIMDRDCDEYFPDEISFYHYEMQSKLVGVCFSKIEAQRLVGLIDKHLNPKYYRLYRSDIKGYSELEEIAEYFRNKASELWGGKDEECI